MEYGEQAHVPTQCLVESELDAAERLHALNTMPDRAITGNVLSFFKNCIACIVIFLMYKTSLGPKKR
jgi:hypothetical protein